MLCVLRPVKSDDASDKASDIARLRKDILPSQYRAARMVRPVLYENTSMLLEVTVKVSDFISLELDKSEAATQLTICFNWFAEILSWDPSKYNGLSSITVYTSEVWRPDIEIFNHVDFNSQYFTPAIMFLQANGTVEWCPQIKATVSCDTDMSHFPHDTHECILLIGSSTYSYEELILAPRLIRDYNMSKNSARFSNWDLEDVVFTLAKGSETEDYYDYALQLVFRVSRRFSLHRYSFTLPLFTCAILTFLFCWVPLTDEKRFPLALVSVILNLCLMIRYSDTLRHSVRTPWGLRFAGDLMLFTCCMIALQILCLALEEFLVPFATHPMVDRLLSTTFVSAYVLNERIVLINEEEVDPEAEVDDTDLGEDAHASQEIKPSDDPTLSKVPGPEDGQPDRRGRLRSETHIVEETMEITSVNQSWRNLLIVTMRISVTVFLGSYAFVYYILDKFLEF